MRIKRTAKRQLEAVEEVVKASADSPCPEPEPPETVDDSCMHMAAEVGGLPNQPDLPEQACVQADVGGVYGPAVHLQDEGYPFGHTHTVTYVCTYLHTHIHTYGTSHKNSEWLHNGDYTITCAFLGTPVIVHLAVHGFVHFPTSRQQQTR